MISLPSIFSKLGINHRELEWPIEPGRIQAESWIVSDESALLQQEHVSRFLQGSGWICFADRVMIATPEALASAGSTAQFLQQSSRFGPILGAELCFKSPTSHSIHLRQRGSGLQLTKFTRSQAEPGNDSSWVVTHRFCGVRNAAPGAGDLPDLLYEVCWMPPEIDAAGPLEPRFSRFAGFAT